MSAAPALLGAVSMIIGSVGCVDTDAAVFVEASITDQTTTVTSNALGTYVGGSFLLTLHLGPRASGDSQVALRSVSVVNGDQSSEVIPALAVATDPDFPVTVQPDSDGLIDFTFDEQDNTLPSATLDDLCTSAGISLVVALDDSLRGATITATSDAFYPETGCP